eukprot:12801975-Prorocentrum_lima.AAC.1
MCPSSFLMLCFHPIREYPSQLATSLIVTGTLFIYATHVPKVVPWFCEAIDKILRPLVDVQDLVPDVI